jgi:hypothetical protein
LRTTAFQVFEGVRVMVANTFRLFIINGGHRGSLD